MKKIKLSLAILSSLFLISCSHSSNEDDKEYYMAKANEYLKSVVDNNEKMGINSFEIVSIDSITDLSESTAAKNELWPLFMKFQQSVDYVQKLKEIDETLGNEYSDMTIEALDEMSSLKDSFDKETKRAEKIPYKVVGKEVHYKVNFEHPDGTKTKDVVVTLYFDNEKDLPKKWNSFGA